jgi:hypothetical protein
LILGLSIVYYGYEDANDPKAKSLIIISEFQLTQVITYIEQLTRASPWWFVYKVLSAMGAQITGIYPTLIIVIVNFQHTFWNEEPSIVSNTLQWRVSRPGPTDTLCTQRGVEVQLAMARENSGFIADRNMKQLPNLSVDDAL